jgi:hypothetical protein
MSEPMTSVRPRSALRWPVIILTVLTVIAFGPIVSALGAGAIAQSHGCILNEGDVHPCIVMGVDIGGQLHGMGVMGWLFLMTMPLAAVAIIGWIVLAVVAIRRRMTA